MKDTSRIMLALIIVMIGLVGVSVWGKQARTCNEYLRKGSMALVEGRLICDPKTGGPRIWKRQDGTEGASFEISAYNVRFLSTREAEAMAEPQDSGEDEPF